MIGYTDRTAAIGREQKHKLAPFKNGIFLPAVEEKRRIAGTWKRVKKKGGGTLEVAWFEPPSPASLRALERARQRLEQFYT